MDAGSNRLESRSICFVTTLPVTLRTFVHPQAAYLVTHGWDVTFVCADDREFATQVPQGVRYVPLPFRRGIDPFGIPRAILLLARFFRREQFDMVQYSTPNAAFYASTAAWLARVPVRIYAQWGIRYVGFEGLRRLVFKRLEAWTCRRSTVVEPDSVSNLEFSITEGLYGPEEARVIWNGSACGIDLQRFAHERKDEWRALWRSKAGISEDDLVIGFVGSIRRDKGCDELLRAAQEVFMQVDNAYLLLIGDTEYIDTVEPDLREWAAESERVILVPPSAEVPQYVACMDVLTLPSHREGFGLVIVEAEAMGVPVVVSDVPGPRDAMIEGETGLMVPVKNAAALATALGQLLTDQELRETMGARAREFAVANFEQGEFMRRALLDKESLVCGERA